MKFYIVVLLFLVYGNLMPVFSQTIKEFQIDSTANVQEIYSEIGCSPSNALLVFYSVIPNLDIELDSAYIDRLLRRFDYDTKNNCYKFCVKPTEETGQYSKYHFHITAQSYKPDTHFCTINIGQVLSFKIDEKLKDPKINAGQVPSLTIIEPHEKEPIEPTTLYTEIARQQAEDAQLREIMKALDELPKPKPQPKIPNPKKLENAHAYNDRKKFHIGAVAGLALANQNSDTWVYEDAKNAKVGLYAGLLFEYKFIPYLSFQPELLFVQKGAIGHAHNSGSYVYENTVQYFSDVNVEMTMLINYLELPLNVIINIPTGRNNTAFFGGGYTFAYGLSGKSTLDCSKDGLTLELPYPYGEIAGDVFGGEEPLLKRFDNCYNILAGYRFDRFCLRVGYEFGGGNIAANSGPGYYYFKNTCFNLSVGVKF